MFLQVYYPREARQSITVNIIFCRAQLRSSMTYVMYMFSHLSVYHSQAGTMWRQMNIGSRAFHRRIAQGL